MEKKLYEKKRMVAADMNEALGGLTRQEIEDRKKAGYRKAADVLQDPRDIKMKKLVKVKKKKVSEETLDEAGLAPKTWRSKLYRTGLRAIRDVEREKRDSSGADSEKQAADLRKSHGVERPEDSKKVGVLRRNWNTFRGREADYVKKDEPSKGGLGGKIARKALQVVAGTLKSV